MPFTTAWMLHKLRKTQEFVADPDYGDLPTPKVNPLTQTATTPAAPGDKS
jgi:hypothetical protein